ncbi:NUDIX domain-containing protein [Streptomyces paludis]|uniref:NUDIX domain-containing protein n=1 Tax=Streptomyces paludis TaxID=2282738 RepID=A0A345HIB6_9ACTN|nr:NUDIX domain-containing protein [Streptomyces paludis]AXG76440.1 NUDIX domain-containing protein [Streptomyces paludis]
MSGKRSAGLLVHRAGDTGTEVLLGHMGGPFWAGRHAAAWSVPKGEYGPGETPEAAARREFREELGLEPPEGPWIPLGESRQRGGKTVTVWAVEGDLDPARVVPGTFTLEWPRGSGVLRDFPELDRVGWFPLADAVEPLVAGQRVFLERLDSFIATGRRPSAAGHGE